MKRTLAIIIAVVMVVGLMAACGNSGSSSTAAPSTAASSAPRFRRTCFQRRIGTNTGCGKNRSLEDLHHGRR